MSVTQVCAYIIVLIVWKVSYIARDAYLVQNLKGTAIKTAWIKIYM